MKDQVGLSDNTNRQIAREYEEAKRESAAVITELQIQFRFTIQNDSNNEIFLNLPVPVYAAAPASMSSRELPYRRDCNSL